MKVLLVAALLALAASIEAATNCHWGPGYWCKSRETAMECRQTRYCQDNVWKGNSVSLEKGHVKGQVECTICTVVVEFVQQELAKNATEDEIENGLKKICSDLGSLESACVSLLDQYFPQIWEMLVNKVTPGGICSGLDLCSSSSSEKQALRKPKVGVAKARKAGVGGIECEVCQLVVKFAKDELANNSTESEVQQALEDFCSNLGALGGECKDLVDQYFPQIWQLLLGQLDPQTICAQIGLCSNSSMLHSRLAKGQSSVLKGIVCDACTLVAKEMVGVINTSSTEKETKEALMLACNYMGGFASVCRSLIDAAWPEIFSNIMNIVAQPKKLCVLMKLCSDTKVMKVDKAMPKKVGVGGIECEVCQLVVKFAKDQLGNNSTESEVQQALEDFCSNLGALGGECKDLVDQYFPQIWQLLLSQLDPQTICAQIGLCSNSTRWHKKFRSQFIKAPQSTACDLCKLVTSLLKPYMDSNTTEAEIKAAVDQACQLLPGALGDECKSLIDTYFEPIWDLVKQEVDTGEVCTQLGLCTNSIKTGLRMKIKKVSRPQVDLCDVCKLVTNYLKPYVDSNTTEQEVKSAVEQVCSFLPGSISSQCSSVVDQYFDMIWQLLKQEVDSAMICTQLGLCNSTKEVQLKKVKVALQATVCDLCNIVVTFVKPYVDSSSTQQEVLEGLEKVCGALPGDLSTQCTSVVDQYFPLIWSLVQQEVDSGEVCKQIGLCNATLLAIRKKHMKFSANSMTCEVCQLVTKELKTLMAKNDSQTEVQDTLKKVCSIVPGSLGDNCTKMVNQYFLMGWVVMKQMVDSGTLCNYIKMCNSNSGVFKYLGHTEMQGVEDECGVCKVVVETVLNILKSNKTLDEAKHEMERVCPYLVGFSSQCKKIIEMYLPQIWQFLEENMDPSTVCKEINLCQGMKSIRLAVKPKLINVKGVIECELCTLVMKELVSLVDGNNTKQAIEDALDKVCGLIPTFGNECKALVNEYSDKIINLILSGVGPREICKLITLCTSSSKIKTVQMAGGIECTVCKDVLTVAKIAIGSNTAEGEVTKVVEKVCDMVSSGIKSECKNFISTFGPELIQLLSKAIEPAVICREIKLCSASSVMDPWAKTAHKY